MTTQLEGDLLMRKGAEFFAQGKFEKAYEHYGKAVRAYTGSSLPVPPERVALGWYTRALLVLRGHVEGDVLANVEQGEVIANREGANPACRRFSGLFHYLRGWQLRLERSFEKAKAELELAAATLATFGNNVDLMELQREQAMLAIERRDFDAAVEIATQAVSRSTTPEQRIFGRMLLADVHDARGHLPAAAAALNEALGVAMEHRLEGEKEKLRQRLKRLSVDHPEMHIPKEPERWV